MNLCVWLSASTTMTKTNSLTHSVQTSCRFIPFITLLFKDFFFSKFAVIIFVFVVVFGCRFSSFAQKIILDTMASNKWWLANPIRLNWAFESTKIYIIKANNDDDHHHRRLKNSFLQAKKNYTISSGAQKSQTKANYSFHFARVCAHIMARADGRAN